MRDSFSPVRLLRGAAAASALIGILIAAWLADKAFRYPSTRAVQFGAEAPLWFPFMLFVAGCTAFIVYLFLHAARRVEAGEDLFAGHRRQRTASSEGEAE